MKPDEWADAWQHPLIHGQRDEKRLPSTAREFLVSFGLPRVVIFEWRSPFEISFSPLQKELVAYNTVFSWGDFYNEVLDRDWSHELVVGEEEICNGHAAFCVHEDGGAVSRLDCELLRDPQCFVNSSIELFGISLLLAQKWSRVVHSGRASPSVDSFDRLANELKRADPRAFEDQKSFWPSLIETVLENPDDDPLELEITSDPARSTPRF
jgi:hypothetical protein